MKNLFIGRRDLEEASRITNLRDFILFLENTPYTVESTTEASIYGIEEILLRNLLSISEKIMNFIRVMGFVHEDIAYFLGKRFVKYEVIAIEGIINSGLENRGIYDFALSRDLRNSVGKAKDMEEFVTMLEDTRYRNAIMDVMDDYRKTESALILNLALERAYLSELWLSIEGLPKSDREMARELTGIEIDAVNILTLLRIRDPYQRRRFIIPYYCNLKERHMARCIKSTKTADIVTMLFRSPYRDLCKEIGRSEEKGSLLPVELGLRRYSLNKSKTALSALSGDPFGIGAILAFLKMKEIEFENLRAIAVGIENKLPFEEIRELLVYEPSEVSPGVYRAF